METKISVKKIKEILNTATDGDVEILNLIVVSCKNISRESNEEICLPWLLICDKKGRTPLHLASMHGHVNVLNYIWKEILKSTKSKKVKNHLIDMNDHKGRTALFYASARGHEEAVSYLINREASLEACTNEDHISPGSTPLMASAEKNTVKCFELLLEAKANVMNRRTDGADALYMASRYGNHQIIKMLAINNQIEQIVNRETFHGRTAIMTAALHGHIDACKELHECGAKLNYQDHDKLTALILATSEGHLFVIRWLVVNGADMDIKDKHGGSALDVALGKGHSEIVNFLIESQRIKKHGAGVDYLEKIAELT